MKVQSNRNRFNRIGRFYLLALSGIALIIVVSQLLIQNHIAKQQNDSAVINIAGRQRMLSQKISKLALLIKNEPSQNQQLTFFNELQTALDLWEKSHFALRNGDPMLGIEPRTNSTAISAMFDSLENDFKVMSNNAKAILNMPINQPESINSPLINATEQILAKEHTYLTGMDEIVFQFQKEAVAKVDRLRNIEIVLFVVALSIIILEFFLIFRPLASQIKTTVSHLMSSEEHAKSMTKEINKLYRELGQSYQELEAVNLEPSDPSIFAKMDVDGNVTYKSEAFLSMLEEEGTSIDNFSEWLKNENYSQDFRENIMAFLKRGDSWNGQLKVTNTMGDFSWLETNMIPVLLEDGQLNSLIMVARDMTEEKEARIRSREINRAEIEKKVKEQQYRSELILEGQEEERNRISREMHDGVGQILTALKMNMESIVPSSSVHTRKRLDESKVLLKNLIGEVRRISFNLRPSSLNDFGIIPAVKKFTSEISAFSGIEVKFVNRTEFVGRLDGIVETNLYRIIQEAVNNAIKYAKPDLITVAFEHGFEHLSIIIQDNGIGFNVQNLESKGHFELSGHGIFNMKERAAFIKSEFKLSSEAGKGTTIKIELPLEQ